MLEEEEVQGHDRILFDPTGARVRIRADVNEANWGPTWWGGTVVLLRRRWQPWVVPSEWWRKWWELKQQV
eukprot:7057119-Heterocapsa_arctica.AAC.1